MKTQILMASMITGFVLVAGNASARGGPDFATLDANGDGELTLEEVENAGEARFAAIDTNSDGALSVEELAAKATSDAADRAAKWLERMDDNADGSLTIDEMRMPRPERAARMFDRIDENEDGVISAEEFEKVGKRMSRRGEGRGRGHGEGRGRDRG